MQARVINPPVSSNIQLDKSCLMCAKFRVCTVFKAMQRLISEAFTDETAPIQAPKLAIICREYLSEAATKMIVSGVST